MKPILLIPALALILGGTNVQAQPEVHEGFGKGALRQLGLSAEQKAKLVELRKSQRSTLQALREKAKQARKDFHSKLQSDASDADLRAAHSAMQSAMKEMSDARFERMLAMRTILTPEQRTKFRSLHAEHGKKWAEKRMKKFEDDEVSE